MVKPLPSTFIETLKKSAMPIDPTKLYQCAGCYRPNVTADFVAVLSRGEAYCKACVKEEPHGN